MQKRHTDLKQCRIQRCLLGPRISIRKSDSRDAAPKASGFWRFPFAWKNIARRPHRSLESAAELLHPPFRRCSFAPTVNSSRFTLLSRGEPPLAPFLRGSQSAPHPEVPHCATAAAPRPTSVRENMLLAAPLDSAPRPNARFSRSGATPKSPRIPSTSFDRAAAHSIARSAWKWKMGYDKPSNVVDKQDWPELFPYCSQISLFGLKAALFSGPLEHGGSQEHQRVLSRLESITRSLPILTASKKAFMALPLQIQVQKKPRVCPQWR
jgi:hypothetical protein